MPRTTRVGMITLRWKLQGIFKATRLLEEERQQPPCLELPTCYQRRHTILSQASGLRQINVEQDPLHSNFRPPATPARPVPSFVITLHADPTTCCRLITHHAAIAIHCKARTMIGVSWPADSYRDIKRRGRPQPEHDQPSPTGFTFLSVVDKIRRHLRRALTTFISPRLANAQVSSSSTIHTPSFSLSRSGHKTCCNGRFEESKQDYRGEITHNGYRTSYEKFPEAVRSGISG